MPKDPNVPARVLSPADIDTLLTRLRDLEADRWTALSTYFEVMAWLTNRQALEIEERFPWATSQPIAISQ